MKRVWILGATLLLAGCGLPPTIQVASYVVDGISYLVSDKSLTDHVISTALDQDCALLRVVKDRRVCVDDRSVPTIAALGNGDILEVAIEPEPQLVVLVEAPTMADEVSSEAIEALGRISPAAGGPAADGGTKSLVDAGGPLFAPPSAAVLVEGRYLVLASFRDRAYATRALDRYAALAPRIAPARIDNRQWHRVVVGPLADASMAETRRQVTALGVAGAWPLTLCAYDRGPRSCNAPSIQPVPAGDVVEVAQAPIL